MGDFFIKLYKKLVNHYNNESGFVTVPLNNFKCYRFVSAFLYFRFKQQLGAVPGSSVVAFVLVKKISELSLTIPPYLHNYKIAYTNEDVLRTDVLDNYFDINDINIAQYQILCTLTVNLSKKEELEKSKFCYKKAFKNLGTEEKLAVH